MSHPHELPSLTAFPVDYSRVEAMVQAHVPQWRGMGFDSVVAIARGGLAPGLMASTALSLPLHALSYDRAQRRVQWFSAESPPPGSRVLLVEDIAGRGTTLTDCVDFLRRAGHNAAVFTLAYDDESRIRPDFGLKMSSGRRAWFPWEREAITAGFAATGNQPAQPEYHYASWAIDLDGVLLPDIPAHHYETDLAAALARRDRLVPNAVLPDRDLSQLTIITGRPEQDRARTQAWLNLHGFRGPLIMRDPARHEPAQTAEHKAQAILEGGHTHFIESEAAQALEIARRVKVANVYWWNGREALAVYANEVQTLRHA